PLFLLLPGILNSETLFRIKILLHLILKRKINEKMINSSTPEKELVKKLVNGDEMAFKEIFYRYKGRLFSYCCRFTKSEALAEDIVQEVLIKIWTNREQINPERAFSSYLDTITRNHSLNFLKKAASNAALKERLFHDYDKTHCEPESQLVYREWSKIAKKAIALLP